MFIRTSFQIAALTALLSWSITPSVASAATAQQEKMTTCNADAKTKALKGDERKEFMKGCLSAEKAEAKPMNSQQQKMVNCNAQAKTKALKGDERKSFMSGCLKASG